MNAAPLIGVVADRKAYTAGPWVDVPVDGTPHSYIHAIEKAGGVPVIFPSIDALIAEPGRLLDRVDGLFLAGGRDLDAELYGQQAHEHNDIVLRERDELEIALTREARRRGMPIFGACRGMQVMNVAFGGTLTQHLDEHVEMTPHRDVVGVFTSHPVQVVPGSQLHQAIGSESFDIASHHHQSVDKLAEGFVATATAPDGIVEAFEDPTQAFCVGVQWHPEEKLDSEGLGVIKAFVGASKEYSGAVGR